MVDTKRIRTKNFLQKDDNKGDLVSTTVHPFCLLSRINKKCRFYSYEITKCNFAKKVDIFLLT